MDGIACRKPPPAALPGKPPLRFLEMGGGVRTSRVQLREVRMIDCLRVKKPRLVQCVNLRIRCPTIAEGNARQVNVRKKVGKFVVVSFKVRHGNAVDEPKVFLFVAGDGNCFHDREGEGACPEGQAFFLSVHNVRHVG